MNGDQESPTGDRLPKPGRVRPRRWVSVILGTVIFLSGLIIGGTGTFTALREVAIYRVHHPEKRILQDARVLQRRLDLTDDQTQEVLAIFSRHLKVFMQFQSEIRPDLDAKLDRLKTEVAAVLHGKQAEKWNTWFEETRKTWMPSLPSSEAESAKD